MSHSDIYLVNWWIEILTVYLLLQKWTEHFQLVQYLTHSGVNHAQYILYRQDSYNQFSTDFLGLWNYIKKVQRYVIFRKHPQFLTILSNIADLCLFVRAHIPVASILGEQFSGGIHFHAAQPPAFPWPQHNTSAPILARRGRGVLSTRLASAPLASKQ